MCCHTKECSRKFGTPHARFCSPPPNKEHSLIAVVDLEEGPVELGRGGGQNLYMVGLEWPNDFVLIKYWFCRVTILLENVENAELLYLHDIYTKTNPDKGK